MCILFLDASKEGCKIFEWGDCGCEVGLLMGLYKDQKVTGSKDRHDKCYNK
jgi:hypothetical protein